MSKLPTISIGLIAIVVLLLFTILSNGAVVASRQKFDQQNLLQFFTASDTNRELSFHSYSISNSGTENDLINTHLLGLIRDRVAYIAVENEEVIAVALPAIAEDGFNGTVDLLVSIDMFGRIGAARVLEDLESNEDFGVIDVIQSQWMRGFSGSSMRDIQRLSWQTIEDVNEYDQFVGASITPRAVADRIYDVLVFFQTNRIAFINSVQ
ncbi:MAG: hypothetical protein GKR91_02050 [Pseudomonadales bacterium]|nr:hypothetical protein [Pseudomonadales bacterium]